MFVYSEIRLRFTITMDDNLSLSKDMILSAFDLVAGINRGGSDAPESGALGGPTPSSSKETERDVRVARTETLGSSFDVSGTHAISPTGTSTMARTSPRTPVHAVRSMCMLSARYGTPHMPPDKVIDERKRLFKYKYDSGKGKGRKGKGRELKSSDSSFWLIKIIL